MPYYDSNVCSSCGDSVPREHMVASDGGRVCWFCYSAADDDDDADDLGTDMWDDDDDDDDLWELDE